MAEVLCKISSYDISKWIIKNTYEVNTEPEFESWKDGNFHEHRIYVRDRIKGSFDVILFGASNTNYQSFLTRLNNATSNRLTAMSVYVQNTNALVTGSFYVEVAGTQHAWTDDGRVVNKVTLKIEEY